MTEKQWYAYSMPKGINLIEGDKMPVRKPERSDFYATDQDGGRIGPFYATDYKNALDKYDAAIQAAKESSVPIQDQERAKRIIMQWLNDQPLGQGMIERDRVHGPFTVEYEIHNKWIEHYSQEDIERGIVPMGSITHDQEQVAILYDDTPEKDHDTVLKEFADKMSKQEDIPKDIQAVVNKRFWDMLDTPEKEESQEEGIRLLEKCDRTFESLRKIVIVLKEAEPEKLPELVHNIEIDFQGIQAVIRDYTRKQ